jgi:hypothetical protein
MANLDNMEIQRDDAGSVSAQNDSQGLEVARSDPYWLDDGNVILLAESTMFKVHQSVLSKHSTMFRTMFSLPQPSMDVTNPSCGCPQVGLQDLAKDIEFMLRAFYGERYQIRRLILLFRADDSLLRLWERDKPVTLNTLGSMLRMGKKYSVRDFLQEADRRLQVEFSDNWKGYLKAYNEYSEIRLEGGTSNQDVLRLLLDSGWRKFLPAAFFTVAGTSAKEIMSYDLPLGSIVTLVVGGERFRKRACDLHELLKEKCNRDACRNIRKDRLIQWFGVSTASLSNLFARDCSSWTKDVCVPCIERIDREHPKIMDKIWDNLPSMFDLPSWEELQEEHKRVMELDPYVTLH